jgi:hypothetical protein
MKSAAARPSRPSALPANAFIGRETMPTSVEVAAELQGASLVWDQLLAAVAERHAATFHEWKSYSPKRGWALRVAQKARTIVWLSPASNAFIASVILGDRAVAAANAKQLPREVVVALATAPKYAEGTGVRLVITNAKQLPGLLELIAIKVAH